MYDPSTHRQKGDKGEDLAEEFLNNLGYKTLVKNYCIKGGEIDLIMQSPHSPENNEEEIVFVEVKTRYSHSKFGSIYESITPQKLAFMQKAIEKYFFVRKKDMYNEKFRIDAVMIQMDSPEGKKIDHIKNAFSFDDFFDTMY